MDVIDGIAAHPTLVATSVAIKAMMMNVQINLGVRKRMATTANPAITVKMKTKVKKLNQRKLRLKLVTRRVLQKMIYLTMELQIL